MKLYNIHTSNDKALYPLHGTNADGPIFFGNKNWRNLLKFPNQLLLWVHFDWVYWLFIDITFTCDGDILIVNTTDINDTEVKKKWRKYLICFKEKINLTWKKRDFARGAFGLWAASFGIMIREFCICRSVTSIWRMMFWFNSL